MSMDDNRDSVDIDVLKLLKLPELKAELTFRHLPETGLKAELLERLLKDNERLIAEGNQEFLIEARKKHDAELRDIVELRDKFKELSMLKTNLQNADKQNNQQSSESVQLSQQDLVMSHSENSNILYQIVNQLAATQNAIANTLAEFSPTVQMFSTNDTANAIPIFKGCDTENTTEWIKEVDRIASHAHWTPSLTLVNAITRLDGAAKNWHEVSGRKCSNYEDWKNSLIKRFNISMSFAEFIVYQAKRQLHSDETLIDYIYGKDAVIQKAPFEISQKDRVSLIIEGIKDPIWSIPLATQNSLTVDELIDHARPLDKIRKLKDISKPFKKMSLSSSKNLDYLGNSEYSNSGYSFIRKFNPETDKEEDQICFNCREKGHISPHCPDRLNLSKSTNDFRKESEAKSVRVDQKFKKNLEWKPKKEFTKDSPSDQVNCIRTNEYVLTMVPVLLNGDSAIDALPDSGSVVTLIRRSVVPPSVHIYPWQKGSFRVAGSVVTPVGWFTARIQLGKIDYVMPQIGICEDLPVPMILGKDWQTAVYARIVYEPDGSVCIMTPSSTELFECAKPVNDSVGCIMYVRNAEQVRVVDVPSNLKLPNLHPSSVVDMTKIHDSNEISIDEVEMENTSDTFNMNTHQQKQLNDIIEEFNDIFATDDSHLGLFPDLELSIDLKHDRPIKCKPYRLSEPDRVFLKKTVEDWLEQGVCRISNSAYAAPMFVIQQPFHPSTPLRPVVDYSRTINPITIPDPQPIDRMDDIIMYIAKFRFKFLLDVFHAYHNIKIKESDIHKTAVVTPDYHIEFMRVMFGLQNGPAIMSRVIKKTYGHLFDEGVRTYFDDVPGGAHTFEELLTLLRKVFEATRKKNLKLKKQKCIFAAEEIPLFGRIISVNGEKPDPVRTAAVSRYKTLSSLRELQSFLGFANCFRRHIKMFASIAKSLTELLRGRLPKKTKNEAIDYSKIGKTKITLDENQQNAFEKIKSLLISPPVLAFFQQNAPTFVETDASYVGIGACLLQEQYGKKRVIEYASRSLKGPETKYHINELEVTAVHWALTVKFRLYLQGTPFTLITDNYTTAYVVNKAKMNRKFARYVVDFAAFNFTPVHRPGKENVIADHLSRYPMANDFCLTIIMSQDSRLQAAQRSDGFSSQIITKLVQEPVSHHLKQIHENYKFDNDILMHIVQDNGHACERIVIPQSLRSSVLKLCHDDSGHFDFAATLVRVKARYWWKSLRSDVKNYTKSCLVCAQVNRRTTLAYGHLGERPIPEMPWQIVSADHIVSLPKTDAGNLYILVHIDHATRFVLAKPMNSLTAEDVIHTIENDIIFTYGPPLTYISDNGTCFTSQATRALFSKYAIEHLPSTPYTAQSNGLVERANGTIIAVLQKMALENSSDWDKLLPNALLCINTVQQKSTRFSPFYLLHGYQPRIPPNEIHLGTISDDLSRINQLELLSEARGIAIERLCEVHDTNKTRFDIRRIDVKFKEGDTVLYNWPKSGDGKLTPKFKGPYRVEQPIGSVCYRIRQVSNPSKVKVAHVQFLRLLPPPPNLDDPGIITEEATDELTLSNDSPSISTMDVPISRTGRPILKPSKFKDFVLD